MGTDLLDAVHERIDTPVESFKGKGGNKVGSLGEAESFEDGKNTVGTHKLCSIKQRQALLAHQLHRFPAKFIEHTDGFPFLSLVVNISHTDKGQKEVGKRSKIAGGAQ